jgi:hypothetical protein
MNKIEVGDLIYKLTLNIAGMTEYGVSFEALMAGEIPPPPEGAKFDIHFTGVADGPKIKGKVTGVDYLNMRADGRSDLDVYVTITTDDGQNIAARVGGVAAPRPNTSLVDLRENVTLFTSSEDYKWVNGIEIWATGTVDLATGTISISAYSA